ncbi:MAG: hypothetical protein JXR53_11345 [Bacteroidales bacterium]|nr:hypothetical protein [Bacteroidales bacterium]
MKKVGIIFFLVVILFTSCGRNSKSDLTIEIKTPVKKESIIKARAQLSYKERNKMWSSGILITNLLKDRVLKQLLIGDWSCIGMKIGQYPCTLNILLADQIKKSILHFKQNEFSLENEIVYEASVQYSQLTGYHIDTTDERSFIQYEYLKYYQTVDNIQRMISIFIKTNDKRYNDCCDCCITCGGFYILGDSLLFENGGYLFYFTKMNDS